ncbi:hypothetical protein ACFTZB_06480 [Rhodococcus sp. NPDC057014]|uniref:hypothetical protein n=1 Tax=Rhodococcus sp. NPDC057014 TaxID=3346000 RepID=UPI003636211E
MAAMLVPGGTSGWANLGMGCFLIALAMWVTGEMADRSIALPCAADLTAMAVILLFVAPASTNSAALPTHAHRLSHDHAESLGRTMMDPSIWLGPLVLTCWAAIVLYPVLARRRPIGNQAKVAVASGLLMLTGMAPMAT